MDQEIRELFEAMISPRLDSIRGDVRAMDTEVEGLRREVLAEIRKLEIAVRRIESVMARDMVRLEETLDSSLAAMNEKLDSQPY